MEYSFLAARLSFTFDVHMCVFHLANKLCCCCCIKGLKSISRTQAATDNGTFTAAFAYRKENKHVVLICKIDLNS